MSEAVRETSCDWTVTGMDCGSCATKIKDAVARLPGVSGVEVGIMSERLRLTLDEAQTGRDKVEKTVRALGYEIAPRAAGAKKDFVLPGAQSAPEQSDMHQDQDHSAHAAAGHDHSGHDHGPEAASTKRDDSDHGSPGHVHDDPADRGKRWYQTAKGRLVIFTALLLGAAWVIEYLAPEIGKWAFVAACLIGVAPVAQRAFAALRMGQPFTIESLMTIAAIGALFINAAEEAALVVFLFAVGEVLEGVAAGKARDGIRALANLVPKTAQLVTGDTTREVPAASLSVSQTVLVRPGDRIPADGEIVDGTSGVDESPVTGESVPKTRGPGDSVFAGSINTEAALRVKVTKGPERTLHRPLQPLVYARHRCRGGAGGAGAAAGLWSALGHLGLPRPRAPIDRLPLRAGHLSPRLHRLCHVHRRAARALDEGWCRDRSGSEGRCRDLRQDRDTDAWPPAGDGLGAVRGHHRSRASGRWGVVATVGGVPAWVASPRYAMEHGGLDGLGLRQATIFEEDGKTAVAVFREKTPLGLIAMRDEPRADAKDAVRQLSAMGVTSVILTGDNPRTAAAIAGSLGLKFEADMMPEDKLAYIREIGSKGGVMMIGDGINDAPALKQASVGVAMGSGTDVALETADAAILRDRVTDIPATIRLSRAAMANIRQNVTIALGLKAVFLVTSVFGLTGLWIAILADTGATVLVTLNALRLLRFNPEREA